MILALATLDDRYIPEGTSVFHLMRNIGANVHIAAAATFVVRSSRENYSLLLEALNPFNETYNFGTITGNWSMSGATNLATISEHISSQATLVGYIYEYYIYALTALAAIPLAFLTKRPK